MVLDTAPEHVKMAASILPNIKAEQQEKNEWADD